MMMTVSKHSPSILPDASPGPEIWGGGVSAPGPATWGGAVCGTAGVPLPGSGRTPHPVAAKASAAIMIHAGTVFFMVSSKPLLCR